MSKRMTGPLGLLTAMALWVPIATAAPGAYTDAAAFAANVAGGVTAVDFEALADGTIVSSATQTPAGASSGIVLPGALDDLLDPGGPALDLRIVEDSGDNPANSGTHSLGVADADNFHAITAGSVMSFGFTQPVAAFGLTLITPEEPNGALFDLDAQLVVPGEAVASLSLTDAVSLGTFNGREYRALFLGVVGAAPFSTASLEYDAATPDSGFLFNLDDLVIPIPEPDGWLVLLAGCAALRVMARKREHERRTTC